MTKIRREIGTGLYIITYIFYNKNVFNVISGLKPFIFEGYGINLKHKSIYINNRYN